MIDSTVFLEVFVTVVDGLTRDDISMDTAIKEIPNWDSLAKLSVIAELEDRFQVDIGLGDLAGCRTIADLKELVEKRSVER